MFIPYNFPKYIHNIENDSVFFLTDMTNGAIYPYLEKITYEDIVECFGLNFFAKKNGKLPSNYIECNGFPCHKMIYESFIKGEMNGIMKNSGYAYILLDEKSYLHCEKYPAIRWLNGCQEWYLHGKRHRLDGPAFIDGIDRSWYKDDKLHREDDPAKIWETHVDSMDWHSLIKIYYINGKRIKQNIDKYLLGI